MGNQIKKRKTKSRMADAAPALSQATIDMINTRVTAQFAEWKQTGTPEQKVAGETKLRRMREEPEFMAEMMGKFAKMFSDADTNGDGRLNLEEYRVFSATTKAEAVANGDWREAGDHDEDNYAIMNSVSAEDGFTMAEMQQIMGPWMAKFTELKNADEAAAQ